MRILVTGATGFIGKNLVKRLKNEGYFVGIVTRSSSNIKDVKANIDINIVFDGNVESLIDILLIGKYDGIVHLAALYLPQHNTNDIKKIIESNITFSTSVIEAACKAGIKWFINTGSLFQHYKNAIYSPINLYAATKQAFEDIARFYWESYPVNFVTLKLSDTYGPGDTRRKIINLWKQCAKTGESLKMSAGEQIINILYIDDVIDGYLKLIENINNDSERKYCGESFALPSTEQVSLKELSAIFEKVTKSKLNINWGALPYRNRELMEPINIKKLENWEQKVSFEIGIFKIFLSRMD